MTKKKAKAKKPINAKARAALTAKGAAALHAHDVKAAHAFTVRQRVTVTAPGSFAARQCGYVTRVDAGAGKVGVMLDNKAAEKIFPAGDLAAA